MNFFAQQAKARSNTSKLVLLFALAIVSLILITLFFLVLVLSIYNHSTFHEEMLDADLVIGVAAVIIGVVVLAWGYKSIQLASGGKAIAEAMDGRRINLSTRDADEKKILNVVEEMAIASGIPVPPVYVIEEHGINAFAAGYSIKDAVIGITRGCIVNMNRDELQGIIAHEFSHIFNGDMRLNIRLISTLYGILVIGLIGQILMRTASNFNDRDSRDSRGVIPIFFLGIGLTAIGYIGTMFGNLIKAAVSRQREFLADASAVQYTRNPEGIGNALKKIGGYPLGSYLTTPQAHEISHLFFNQAINVDFSGWMATHPPLQGRIRRIFPYWDGMYIKVTLPEDAKINPYLLRQSRIGIKIDPDAYRKPEPQEQLSSIDFLSATSAAMAGVTVPKPFTAAPSAANTPAHAPVQEPEQSGNSAVESAGTTTPEHINEARQLLDTIPAELTRIARDIYGSQAIIHCLLLDRRANIHEKQLQSIQQSNNVEIYREVMQYKDMVSTLPPRHRLPLLDLCIPTLKELSVTQYEEFKLLLLALIKADNVIELFEWVIYRKIIHHLEEKPDTAIRYDSLESCAIACQRLLSAVALTQQTGSANAETLFQQGWSMLSLPAASLINDALEDMKQLDIALRKTNRLHPLKKPLLIKACCATLKEPDRAESIELIRAISDGLDVPMPPLLANQKLC